MPRYTIGQKVTVIKIVDGKEIILGYSKVTGYNENSVQVVEFENSVEPVEASGVFKKVIKYIINPDIDVHNIHEANLGLRPNDYYGSSFKGNGWKVEKYYNSKVRNRYTG